MSCPRCAGPTFKWERLCLSCDSAGEHRWAYLDLWSAANTMRIKRELVPAAVSRKAFALKKKPRADEPFTVPGAYELDPVTMQIAEPKRLQQFRRAYAG